MLRIFGPLFEALNFNLKTTTQPHPDINMFEPYAQNAALTSKYRNVLD